MLARPGGSAGTRCGALLRAGELESAEGNWPRAREWYQESLALARQTGDRRYIAGSLLHLSFVVGDLGDLEKAHALREEAYQLALDLGDKGVVAQTAWDLAAALFEMGKLAEARALAEESLRSYTAVGNAEGIALGYLRLGFIALREGDLDLGLAMARGGWRGPGTSMPGGWSRSCSA